MKANVNRGVEFKLVCPKIYSIYR